MKKLSKNLYKGAYDDKDKGGSSRKGVVDWKKVGLSPKFFQPKEGMNKINIIPYEVKSKIHPLVRNGKMEIGDLDFMLDIWVHRYMGVNQDIDILCPKRNYGRSCPICDMVSKLYDDGKKDEAKAIQASRRVFMNVQPIVHGEVQELQVFEVSHFLFMKELLEEAYACANGEDVIPFADLEDGKIVKFRTEEESLGKNKMTVFKSFDFIDRDQELDEDIVSKTASFDLGLTLMTSEDIEKVLYGKDDDEDEKPKPKPVEKDDEDEKPRSRPQPKNDDEDEKPKPSAGKSKKSCPNSYPWGDADKHKECKKCDLWDDCIEG